MERLKKKGLFKFQYLPDYAKFLLENKLEEFVTVTIRFCREVELPMLKPLSKLSEQELVALSVQNTKELLESLSKNEIADFMQLRIDDFIANRIKDLSGKQLLNNTELVAEDIILGYYIRRKVFSFFLHSYTQNAVLHTLIISETDYWTSYEHLFTTKAFVQVMNASNTNLSEPTERKE